jgi:putative CocE/NonD family hydrolase
LPTCRAFVLIALAALLSSGLLAARKAAEKSPSGLEALSGEYTDPAEPDTRFSFYPQNGKLMIESDRLVPMAMKTISATEFTVPGANTALTFNVDSSGRGVSVEFSSDPGVAFKRTGKAVHHLFHDYRRSEAMVPMRDGVKLHAVILRPQDIKDPLPILLTRTPYGVDGTSCASFFAERPELARDGYIYVAEDIRGRFKSEGKFVMMRPLADHHDPQAIDESTDAFDSVAWLVKHIPGNNGRVGVLGTSYPGFLAMMAGIDPDPHVKAISPQAPMIDVWMGDDFFHNGAFRQSYGYDYVLGLESSKGMTQVSYGKAKDDDPVDGFNYFLQRGDFAQAVKKSGSRMLPTWKSFIDHPTYDSEWRSRGVEWELDRVSVPTLTVGGYYDQEDMYGPQEEYAKLEAHGAQHDNFLVLGPWRHGSWSSSSRRLGNLNFGQPVGKEFRAEIEARFFAHYLKDPVGTNPSGFDLKDTASFQTGSEYLEVLLAVSSS